MNIFLDFLAVISTRVLLIPFFNRNFLMSSFLRNTFYIVYNPNFFVKLQRRALELFSRYAVIANIDRMEEKKNLQIARKSNSVNAHFPNGRRGGGVSGR